MKLTVLGKYGPYPAAGGGTSAYLVQNGDTTVALDFGSGALGRLQRFASVSDLRAIVLSHLHYDHICDLLPLGYMLQAKGQTLPLFFPDTDCPQRALIHELDGFILTPLGKEATIGNLHFTFTPMQHPLRSYAMRIESDTRTLFYSGDTSFCPQLMPAAEGSDLLLLDCGKAENSSAPHLSLAEAAYLAKTLQTPVIASHLHPELHYASASPFVTLAQEGETYTV